MDTKDYRLERMKNYEGMLLSDGAYNITIGLTLLWGFLINAGMIFFLSPYILKIHPGIMIASYLVLSLGCITLVVKSRKPALSFLGFTGLAVGMGLVITFIVSMYSGTTVYSAFLATGIIVVSMMIISTIKPAFFMSIGRSLVYALLGSIAIELIGGLIFRMPLTWMDYVVVVIFAGFIGYDWARAQMYPKTLDNAIDSAADIYVDIVNIFIRLLEIFGKKD